MLRFFKPGLPAQYLRQQNAIAVGAGSQFTISSEVYPLYINPCVMAKLQLRYIFLPTIISAYTVLQITKHFNGTIKLPSNEDILMLQKNKCGSGTVPFIFAAIS